MAPQHTLILGYLFLKVPFRQVSKISRKQRITWQEKDYVEGGQYVKDSDGYHFIS